jgi:hypothetical protein
VSRLPTSAYAPPPADRRTLYVMADIGTGLSPPEPRWEYRHACGRFTPADGKYCIHCGGVVTLPADLEELARPRPAPEPPEPPRGSFGNPAEGTFEAPAGRRTGFNDDERAAELMRRAARPPEKQSGT